MKFKKLVISPHIDDEVLGCGGILDEDTFILECGVDDYHIVCRSDRIAELKEAKKILNFSFDILNNKWGLSSDTSVNYITKFKKN